MAPARRAPRLLIVDPSTGYPEGQGARVAAGDWPGEVRLLFPALSPGDGPDASTGYDTEGVIVLGSRASVHDDLDWLARLSDWLRPIVEGERDVPLLGICFGHQLVCHLAGGEVGMIDPDGHKLVAYERTQLDESRLVPDRVEMEVVASHKEGVLAAPPGFRVTGRRDCSPVDLVEHPERPVFGAQFHPEAREEFTGCAGLEPSGLTPAFRRDNDALLAAFRTIALER